jgi:hypothetical protein
MYHRVISGLEKNGNVRLLTLTSSKTSGDFQKDFRKLIMRLNRRGLVTSYIRCPEFTKTGLRHEHILFRGDYIDQRYISFLWSKLHDAPVVDIRKVRGKGRLACYLAKYLTKSPSTRYAYSWGWVWRGFATTWKYLKMVSSQNHWTYKELLTNWRWMVKLDRNILEELQWLATNITPNVVSAVEVSGLILGRSYLIS